MLSIPVTCAHCGARPARVTPLGLAWVPLCEACRRLAERETPDLWREPDPDEEKP